ncbi:hypothetical protein [Devosia sp. MC1541]|uniref:hypothetical protein n=1 Tax=Devosia sp. MC1541 TaxID=2725264 RepID=UPI00145FBA4A|nr:hypothetical protein [Devosia sp. MC1541]
MKLTWFGNTAFRIHAGGKILVIDAQGAVGVDHKELCSGADVLLQTSAPVDVISGSSWKPMPRQRLLDADGALREVVVAKLGLGAFVFDSEDEPPLLLLSESVPELGKWADKAVVLIAGGDLAGLADTLTDAAAPRLIALAGGDEEIGAAFEILRSKLDGTGVVALEHGLAVEA